MKKIAILTSGGDSPGMNAAIRAVVRYGISEGMEVFGVENGYAGLINNLIRPLNMRSVSDIIQRGGTILKAARSREFMTSSGRKSALDFLKKQEIEGLVVIGGDGSLTGARILSEMGFPCIGIPGTIDNDLGFTDFTLGFDTACNTVLDAINKLRDTMSSHDRICIIEVMGRNCGDIALYTGIGGGAEIILVPEMPFEIEDIVKKLNIIRSKGKLSSIIVLSEGVGKAGELREAIKERMTAAVRATVLGHLQRGGAPSSIDRFLGTSFGVHAVKLLKAGIGNRIVGIKNNSIFDIDIKEGLDMKKSINLDLYQMASIVSDTTI